jgi:hypothetical protein
VASPSISLCDTLGECFFLLWSQVFDVNALQHAGGQDRLHYLLLYFQRVWPRFAYQTPQRRLVLHMSIVRFLLS